MNNFDIVGDIHGHAEPLIRLLNDLGYTKNDIGIYAHRDRQMIFVGDFIDRGAEQSEVINIVKPMVEKGYAQAVMGNHEFNAICYHTNHPETGIPLRENSERNQRQHQVFLDEYSLREETTGEVIEWFKTLPIFIELNEFRVIHACWNQDSLDFMKPKLTIDNTLSDDLFITASEEGSDEFKAIETLLKGLEIPLPEPFSFNDKDGHKRKRIRIQWWKEGAKTYRDYAQVPPSALNKLPDTILPKSVSNPEYPESNKPVFFGHYWFTGNPEILKTNVACLDYSVANKEKLVCYRWNEGETELSNDNFVMVNAD